MSPDTKNQTEGSGNTPTANNKKQAVGPSDTSTAEANNNKPAEGPDDTPAAAANNNKPAEGPGDTPAAAANSNKPAEGPGDTPAAEAKSNKLAEGPGDTPAVEAKSNKLAEGPGDTPAAKFQDLPNRYLIQETESGNVLTCREMPNISVIVQPGLSFSASTVRKSSGCRIYLDGVAQCEPFMDLEKHIYNFDHHEGVVRPFTVATCEQVLVMVIKGMDLRGRDWKVYANEPDLDTILSIWLLLNHVRINQKDSNAIRGLYTLVRLESVIDTHGLEMIHLCGLPTGLLNKTRKIIDYLREEEIDLKRHGIWEESDYLEHTALVLQKIDRLIYRSEEFLDFQDIQELARVEIVNNRFAVAVASKQGIYELEPFMARLYGENLSIVILQNESGGYTLRRLDHFMPGDLNPIYTKLNFLDPAVKCRKGKNQWGGSGDIGGSPRATGTQLTPQEIAQACRNVFHQPSPMERALRFLYALLVVTIITTAAALIKHYLPTAGWFQTGPVATLISQTDLVSHLSIIILSTLGLMIYSRGRFWQVGLALPIGQGWWFMLPAVVVAVMAGGVTISWDELHTKNSGLEIFYAALLIPLGLELLFRGLAHGILAAGTRVQRCDNHWTISFPSLGAALIYAGFTIFVMFWPNMWPLPDQTLSIVLPFVAALGMGLLTGMVREKSHSLLPSILFQAVAVTIIFVMAELF